MAAGDLKGFFSAAFDSHGATRDATGSVAVSVGDLIVVQVIQQVGMATSGVTDNLGNTYGAIDGGGEDPGNASMRRFASRVTSAGTLTTVTVAGAVTSNDVIIIAAIFEGPFEAPPIDANPTFVDDNTSPFTCPATGTLAQANEIVVAFGGANITSGGSSAWAATSPNTLVTSLASSAPNIVAAMGYQKVAATASVQPAFTADVNPAGAAPLATASFKLTAGGGTVVPIFDNYYRRQRAA